MEVLKMLENQIKGDVNYFILDSHINSAHGDEDYKFYYYNTRRFNKMKPNDIFVYRRPAKGSKERIFQFFGGGVIQDIEKMDDQGNVRARIKNAFKFLFPLKQGDSRLEGFVWKFKTRTSTTWERFFNQYGMNLITKDDFENLFGDLECVPFQMLSTNVSHEEEEEEEEKLVIQTSLQQNFAISIVNDQSFNSPNSKKSTHKRVIVKKTDFIGQHEKNMKLGDFGELKILQYEIENLIQNDRTDLAKLVEHSSKVHGDGLGFDVRSFEIDGTEKFIEVKTTRTNAVDGFYMSPKEIKVSNETANYYIYRLYNLKEDIGTADLYIYSGPCNEEKFKLTPTSYRVNLK